MAIFLGEAPLRAAPRDMSEVSMSKEETDLRVHEYVP